VSVYREVEDPATRLRVLHPQVGTGRAPAPNGVEPLRERARVLPETSALHWRRARELALDGAELEGDGEELALALEAHRVARRGVLPEAVVAHVLARRPPGSLEAAVHLDQLREGRVGLGRRRREQPEPRDQHRELALDARDDLPRARPAVE